MADLGQNILAGILTAAAIAAASAIWRIVRRPFYIPFDDSNWSNAIHVKLRNAGYDPRHGQQGWVINYEVDDYRAQGRIAVRIGRGICTREVRAKRKAGYAVLMR